MIIVDLPQYPVAAKIKWSLKQPTQVNRGEFTGTRRVTILTQAPRWSAEVEYPPILGEAAARPWRAALARLQGQANAFKLVACENPQQWGYGAPKVDGANQMGNLIKTRGWIPNGAFLIGNFVTIGGRLHQVLAQTLMDSSGKAEIEIMPHIADGLADGTPIEGYRPYALMSLTDDVAGWTVGPGQRYDISFSCEEAF